MVSFIWYLSTNAFKKYLANVFKFANKISSFKFFLNSYDNKNAKGKPTKLIAISSQQNSLTFFNVAPCFLFMVKK